MNSLQAPLNGNVAVRLQGVRKVYRLYRKPSYRVRDILGLLPSNARYFDTHVALHDVNLEIRQGEKVAIIGRNGAGKSTLLRLITRVIQPTAGTVEVTGEAQALLSIGTGFHPELTGRQNVLAYLAHFGIAGARAQQMLEGIVEFAELEEYIDQPTKTYSTGMNMRLMFSASTMFTPDLLVIDEVLGVGDAYFQGKSFERIREICSGSGTTLLLVTHDVYTASTLCERMIWIDQGAVLLDADSPTVLKAYDTSIRQQEEARLRKKALMRFDQIRDRQRDHVPVLIELRSPDNAPPLKPIAISRLALMDHELEVASVPHPSAGGTLPGAKEPPELSGAWGAPVEWNGAAGWSMSNFGSAIHKVGVSFPLPAALAARTDELTLEIVAGADCAYRLEVWRIDPDLRTRSLGFLDTLPGSWTALRLSLSGASHPPMEPPRLPMVRPAETGEADAAEPGGAVKERAIPDPPALMRAGEQHGSGRLTVTDVRLLDADARDVVQIPHGSPVTVALRYRINDPALRERCEIVLAFRRNGVDDVYRLYTADLLFDAAARSRGEIVAKLDRLPLGPGEYSLTVLIAAEGYYAEKPTLFFAINPKVYWAGRNIFDFAVESDDLVVQGTGVVGRAAWALEDAAE